MASLCNEEESLHNLEPVARTADAHLTKSQSPFVADGGDADIQQNYRIRSELVDQNSRGSGNPTASKSSLNDTRWSRPLPPAWYHPPQVRKGKMSHLKKDPGNTPLRNVPAYVAVDPFVPSVAQVINSSSHPMKEETESVASYDEITDVPTSRYILAFLFDTLPRQIYLHFLLTLPSLYFSRVARIFEEAELTIPEIKRMAIASTGEERDRFLSYPVTQVTQYAPNSQPVARLKASWEYFIDSLMREWKTLNLVSVLLLSAILTTLQIDGAIMDPYTRYSAFLALVCSLMSLLYGCIYIIRFNTMRRTHKAAEWAEEAQKTKTMIWWNVWVLLAMPAIWLAWSIIFYLTCVMAFLWRTGTSEDTVLEITPLTALGPRLAVTFTFLLGLVYLFLIIREFRRYGAVMDKAWRQRVLEWTEAPQNTHGTQIAQQGPSPWGAGHFVPFSSVPPPEVPPSFFPFQSKKVPKPESPHRLPDDDLPRTSFEVIKIMDLHVGAHISYERPQLLEERNIYHEDWTRFISDASRAWDDPQSQQDPEPSVGPPTAPHTPQDVTARLIASWNAEFFFLRRTQAILCEEEKEESSSLSHAIYLVDSQSSQVEPADQSILAQLFGQIPMGIQRLRIYDPVSPYGSIQKATASRPLYANRSPYTGHQWSSKSLWASDPVVSEGVDRTRSIAGDEHVEVPSLYQVEALEPTRSSIVEHAMPTSEADDEDNGLPTLYDEAPARDRQWDQHNLPHEEYNSENLASRPQDWRPDDSASKTVIPVQTHVTTLVNDISEDPMRPTIHRNLSYATSGSRIVYDLRFLPDPTALSFPFLGRPYNYIDLVQLATAPPVKEMRLFYPLLPWYIDVHQKHDNGITVQDVIMQMYLELQSPVSASYHYNEKLHSVTREKISQAFKVRTEGRPEERSKGLRRVDYMENEVVFVGLVEVEDGTWEIKTR